MISRRSIIPVLLLAPMVLSGGSGYVGSNDLTYEEKEPHRSDLDSRGQRNCVIEASDDPPGSPSCPLVALPAGSFPQEGVEILDSLYTLPGPDNLSSPPSYDTRCNCVAPARLIPGFSPSRGTGVFPDLILPGFGSFQAWWGYWYDEKNRGFIDLNLEASGSSFKALPGNEWRMIDSIEGGLLVSFIEPGSHPSVTTFGRASSATPDISYSPSPPLRWVQRGTFSGFLDGSLLQSYEVTTVSRPLLTPDNEGHPYTAGASSLVDIDLYAALSPTPLQEIYSASLALTVNSLGGPGLQWCPNSCSPLPIPLGGTPAEGAGGEVNTLLFARPLPEWDPSSTSSASGRIDEYRTSFHAWFDVVPRFQLYPRTGPLSLSGGGVTGPVPGRSAGGGPAAAPGWLSFEIWVGVWKDLDGNGHVGSSPPDPYEGGNNPYPEHYIDPSGEFLGTVALDPNTLTPASRIQLTLVPDPDWGPVGVLYSDPDDALLRLNCSSSPARVCIHPVLWRGSTPISINATADAQVLGRYESRTSLLLPLGTLTFSIQICSSTYVVRFASSGIDVEEGVWDCDLLGALT